MAAGGWFNSEYDWIVLSDSFFPGNPPWFFTAKGYCRLPFIQFWDDTFVFFLGLYDVVCISNVAAPGIIESQDIKGRG